MANSLELGCDCLGSIHYLDGIVSNHAGEAVTLKKCICIHEEDDGILWKVRLEDTGRASNLTPV